MYTAGQWVKVTSRNRGNHCLTIGKIYQIIEIDTDVQMGIKLRFGDDNYQWVFRDEICPLFDTYLKQIEEYAV